ncbi:MAG: 3-hydroxyacyl-CoA dehydrogenase family protein [Candidatus Cloacimonetes bacterium]|nr:3-hydroxyacyl-CoA dehydrogenase family protein [Candidatus Cloacimonadota bacterium]MCF7813385.1 3-hydroxyacyl-CoA dehydrogenase family protein [Candidatus Cloacimonadota bacterium]MCF7867490.1 3-hydroxyacyl-CoA dehydrogenase family protein [Candidatus Cloacimonadota bacterium]MCF7883007.1 3-hydroxyacyl-CoA dehydrogenase family protein [Candidatus Cloacimonadota bacterium]
MNYAERLQNVTVLGAAGKMGSGILLLTAIEMVDSSFLPENKDKRFVLNAMDISDEALSGLMKYLKVQVTKIAEKKMVLLRKMYKDRKDLIENGQIIDEYVFDVMNIVRPVTTLESAYKSNLIFEAVAENADLKIKIFKEIDENNPNKPWFFTNTSSVPITKLENEANLKGRILGFHFYNPPAVQKLVELILTKNTDKETEEFALIYAKKLKKKIVYSNDFAGFIGNGHFMRDALYGINKALELAKNENISIAEAIYIVDKISRDFLIRPMGIFQLIDYVGIDVCSFIMDVMNPYLDDEDLYSPELHKMLELGVKGGQLSSGAQKDGFLKYDGGKPVAAYDFEAKKYVDYADIQAKCDEKIGAAPATQKPWKAVNFNKQKSDILTEYFRELNATDSFGCKLAIDYLHNSKQIGKKLVSMNIAKTDEDVNTVLLTGFYHAYGPINNY